MYLLKEKLQHINSIVHEGKVVLFGTDADGKIWYTVKQDGFEDSYLNTPAELRTGWENWQELEFPNENDDQSVIEKEKAELTYQQDTSKFILKSRYKTKEESAIAPVQIISGLGHVYVFRQSKSNTLLVDRFVLDGMTNTLNRKLEVRFKRSKQKHQPTKNMNNGANGLVNIDSLDFRDANGNFFYEPTTELCLVNNLKQGWFSAVLVPTIENDVNRWHIFAYNSQTQKVELTTIRASEEGLFDVKDYTIFEESNETLIPRRIPGVIKRTLDIGGVTITNGLAATKYDLQQEQETQSGEKQLLKTATRLMLAVPTDKGTAAISFAIAGDGTLAEIDEAPNSTTIRSQQKEVLLPLNTLDEIKAFGDRTPPPQGIIIGLAEGSDAEDAEDLVKISTNEKAAELKNGDLVKITSTNHYQGLYHTTKVDENTVEIDLPSGNELGFWEKEEQEAGGLIFDGMITAYEKTADGKLRVTCPNHGLENGDEVQITGTDVYNNTYPVQKIDDTHFVIERKWATGEAVNVKLVSQKRRGLVFDEGGYVEVPYNQQLNPSQFTISYWVKVGKDRPFYCPVINYAFGFIGGYSIYATPEDGWMLEVADESGWQIVTGPAVVLNTWTHVSCTYDGSTHKLYINGIAAGTLETSYVPNTKGPLVIGEASREENPVGFFPSQVAEVCIWNVARSAEDIKNSMYLQLTGKEVGLVGYWRLGAIAEGKVIDFSVNCNDGIVYGNVYVSAATLNRKLAGGTDAVKYSNPELFAVTERATYEESFEFKVKSSSPVNLAYLDNADGKGNKIFTLSYWGKSSRSAEETKTIAAEQIKQNKFEDLGNGWYRAYCNFTIPDGVSLLRSFEIADVKGNWVSLEIRKHRIRLLSDSITEAKYTDSVTLTTVADNQATLAAKLKELELKEVQEAKLLEEKRDLDAKIAAYRAKAADKQAKTQKDIEDLKAKITKLTTEEQTLLSKYNAEKESPFNYLCYLSVKVGENSWKGVHVLNQSDADNTPIVRHSGGGNLFQFFANDNGTYKLGVKVRNSWKRVHILSQSDADTNTLVRTNASGNLFQFSLRDNGIYNISIGIGDSWKGVHVLNQSDADTTTLVRHSGGGNFFKIEKTGEPINKKINQAEQAWQTKLQEIKDGKKQLILLNSVLEATSKDEVSWNERLAQLIKEITRIQTEINTLNTDFLNGVKNTQQTPQTLDQVAKDAKGLITQGALLGFVNPASRLNAIETCEGNVQLSYFDTQGRMRQTNYDATADGRNAAFEQWIPDAQRACLNFGNSNSVVKLNNKPVLLPSDWTIEAWFFYPLPETGEWNTLTSGQNSNHHIWVKNRKQLGIYLKNDSQKPVFYDSGFNMELLPQGWHHLTAVGREDTTLFYIDGKKVGDTKTKALTDAQENLDKTPDNASAKQKVEDIKKAILKVTSGVYAIGNTEVDGQQFGKVAEIRIWGVALSDDEIAVNSKTLLSGNEPGLLAYYPMNEATGDEVRDCSGNGHNGKVFGASWWGCTAPIGNPGNTVMKFDGVNDCVEVPYSPSLNPSQFTVSCWVKIEGGQGSHRSPLTCRADKSGTQGYLIYATPENKWALIVGHGYSWQYLTGSQVDLNTWTHISGTFDGSTLKLYINGKVGGTLKTSYTPNTSSPLRIGAGKTEGNSEYFFRGQIAEVRIWDKARTQEEIQADMYKRLTGKEPNLVAYYPLNEIKPEGSARKVLDLAENNHGARKNHGTVTEAITLDDNTLPIAGDALVSSEYSAVTLEPTTQRKVAVMRRFFAYPATNGATLLPDKRIETLELKWIGNAQFAPTLLGYIEGPAPVPSENLTLSDDYNGASSVRLTMSEDVAFSWNRSQDLGKGLNLELFFGVDVETSAGLLIESLVAKIRAGIKGNLDFSYQSQNESNITSSSSVSMTDKLELRGTPEETPKFPHLGKRFIPKNVGYALVVSALADVFVTRLARSGKMVGYQVQPVDSIPPDVNTITFLINPAYTMNGSLDGMTGSNATSARFFKHVPEMRTQYGSLYPASYYRLQEAYDLKRQIEAEDKRRESYFASFNVGLADEASLDRNINSGAPPADVSAQREEDKPNTQMTEEEKKKAEEQKAEKLKAEAGAAAEERKTAAQKKQTEIQSKINDQDKRVQATNSFASWQKRMESIQIRAGKRNIVNTYVWDADGGLRTEAQSFANTVEHTIGGSFSLNAALGFEGKFGAVAGMGELTAQATINLTQTMSKTEVRSQGFQLNVDLSGMEYKGITDYNDKPILPGEKVDRYRFMSFYLEGSTQNFQDFFSYVVDPEWLASNDEEARALRQAQAGKPNKTWRVLHRVTYVERPALMGFGRDTRKLRAAQKSDKLADVLSKVKELEEKNKKLEGKIDEILNWVKSQQQ